PYDLAGVVDAEGAAGDIEWRVSPPTQQKAAGGAIGISEEPYDLAGGVDAVGPGGRGGSGGSRRGQNGPPLRPPPNAQTQPQGQGRNHANYSHGIELR